MISHTVLRHLLAVGLLAGILAGLGPAHAEGEGIVILLPPGATLSDDKKDAFSEFKHRLRELGYDILAEGEYDPEQKNVEVAKLGASTGVVTYTSGNDGAAEVLRKHLAEHYPDIVTDQRDKKGDSFPEGSLGVLLPEVVMMYKKPELDPPPWDLHLRDVQAEVEGQLTPVQITTLFDENSDSLVACWPKAVARGKRMEGVVKVRISVDGSGGALISSVQEAADLGARWVDCVSAAYLDWTYPAPSNGKAVTIYLSVNFIIDEADVPPEPVEEPAAEPDPPADSTE